MKSISKLALLPCVALLTLAAVPAQAVTVTSSAPTTSSATSGTTSSAKATSKQLKQQTKLSKKCAKLASGKLKAKKRAKLLAMCGTASTTPEEVTKVSSASAGAASAGAANASETAVANANINSVIANSAPVFAGFPMAAAGAGKLADAGFYQGSQATEDQQETENPSTEAEVTAVPEPGTLALLGLGLLGLGLARRRVGR